MQLEPIRCFRAPPWFAVVPSIFSPTFALKVAWPLVERSPDPWEWGGASRDVGRRTLFCHFSCQRSNPVSTVTLRLDLASTITMKP